MQDLTVLNSLIDDRTGYNEDKRISEESIGDVIRGKKNGGDIKAYYERMNSILDGWRGVDEILDSQFPKEVMRRFGTIEEVEQMKGGKNKRMTLTAQGSGDEDSGYEEESEVESDEQVSRPFHRRNTLTARAASALSGFWFGSTPSKSKERKPRVEDEESTLVASPKQTDFLQSRPSYGATSNLASTKPSLSPIHQDSGEVSPSPNPTAQDEVQPKEQVHPKAGVVKAEGEGNRPIAVENDPEAIKQQGRVRKAEENKRRHKSIIVDMHKDTSDTDDEMDSEDFVDEGSLDRKLASEREERKARSKQRTVVVPGTGGMQVRVNGKSLSPSDNGSEQGGKKKKKPTPGGKSERERLKLLQHVPGRAEREDERERAANFAININLAANVLLLAGKAFAVLSSNSVSLLASLVDSALDLLSTIIIFGTSRAIAYRSYHTYLMFPTGKKKLEPIGVLVFATLMIATFLQVLSESVQRLWAVIHAKESGESAHLPPLGVAFMIITIVVKAIMWVKYRKSPSSGVRAVAQDAENDVVFNIASLAFPVIGGKLGWPALDPIGGALLSIYIIWEWIETLAETVTKLSGAAASPDEITRALYLITRFKSVDSVSALELYFNGDETVVEADVVLPINLSLKEAHDLGEIVTYCLESIGQ